MQGPEYAAQRVATWLRARIPVQLRALEARLDLDPGALADPAQVLDHERGPIGVEDWPAVFVLPLRLEGLALVDAEADGSELYRARYATRVLAWVRADDYAATDALRKRYALVIREALLERKALELRPGVWEGNPDTDLTVDPLSIREDYSEVLVDEARRTIAGVDVTVSVTVLEQVAPPPPLGTVLDTEVGTVLLAHPALD